MKTSSKTALLFMLYLSQGLPFGFQATALPVLLRERGVSLAAIGFAGALALPWLFKPLWAPLVDRYWSMRIGKRRSWIIPLQTMMVLTILATIPVAASGSTVSLLVCIFLMNLCAATQDIAVDGLAVDSLGTNELGPGNAAQVAGYKAGMVLGGGILVWLSARAGWEGLFLTMAILAILPLFLVLRYKEIESHESAAVQAPPKLSEFIRTLFKALRSPGAGFLPAFYRHVQNRGGDDRSDVQTLSGGQRLYSAADRFVGRHVGNDCFADRIGRRRLAGGPSSNRARSFYRCDIEIDPSDRRTLAFHRGAYHGTGGGRDRG